MKSEEQGILKERTKAFALAVIRFVNVMERNDVTRVIGRQLLRSGTSVGANYRSACRARSAAEFRAKLEIVEEEADESCYWLKLLLDSGIRDREKAEELLAEADEIIAMTVASIVTSKKGAK